MTAYQLSLRGQHLESECKAYAHQQHQKALAAALAEIEQHAPKSAAWVAAVKKHAAVLSVGAK
jgi:hypothetical protein